MTSLSVGFQLVCNRFHREGIPDLAEHHLSGNFRLKLLPAHELGDHAFLVRRIRRIVLVYRIRRSGFVNSYKNNISFDIDAFLVNEVYSIRLKDHGVIVKLITVCNTAIKLSCYVITHVRNGL